MKPCLVDINVWLALLVQQHVHHKLATEWYEALSTSEAGMCRVVHLGLIRLLSTSALLGDHAVPPLEAWELAERLLEDERVDFVNEPPGLDTVLPSLLRYRAPAGKLVADAYLAAFAMVGSRRLTTIDSGFRQFRGLDLQLLGG